MPDIPAISPSMRSSWRDCPRKVFYRYIAGIQTRTGRRPLVVGKAFHSGLEHYRLTAGKGMSLDARVKEATSIAAAAYVEGAGKESIVFDGYTQYQVAAYVWGYLSAFPDDGVELVEAQAFEEGDGETGFVDFVQRDKDGKLWVIEDKTTAQLVDEQAISMALKLDDQISTYVSVLRARGLPIEGARYRQVKKTLTYPRKGESPRDYGARVWEIYSDPSEVTREIVVTWTDDEIKLLDKHRERSNLDVLSWLDRYELSDWPYNPRACIGPFGPCDYIRLCVKRRDAAERLYQSNGKASLDDGKFQREIWCGQEGNEGGAEGRRAKGGEDVW